MLFGWQPVIITTARKNFAVDKEMASSVPSELKVERVSGFELGTLVKRIILKHQKKNKGDHERNRDISAIH